MSDSGIYHDEVEIEDFDYDPETETFSYPCPCGDLFTILKVSDDECFVNILIDDNIKLNDDDYIFRMIY